MNKKIQIALILVFTLFLVSFDSFSQCAMCRTTVESTISDGRSTIASNLNKGILYLFAAPYLSFFGISYLWFYQSKKEEEKRIYRERIKERVRKIFNGN